MLTPLLPGKPSRSVRKLLAEGNLVALATDSVVPQEVAVACQAGCARILRASTIAASLMLLGSLNFAETAGASEAIPGLRGPRDSRS